MKKELARTLTGALSHFIDENRQGGMCMSSGECEAMEKAFIAEDFDMIGEYVEKKLCGEDERIRKWIVTFIEVRLPDAAEFEPQYRAALAYLEKQKEQKPSDYPYLPGWRKNRDDNKPELKHSVLMLTTHGVAEGEWLGKKWCQYRWSCELKDDEVLYWMHLSDLGRLEKEDEQKEQKPTDLPAGFYYIDLNGNRYYSKEFRYGDMKLKVGEQKPAWSEEDNKMLAGTLNSLKRYQLSMPNYQVELQMRWLKSLRPQPQEEIKFKVGDRVKIHCRKERPEDIAKIYDGKEGDIRYIFDEEHNPWGHIVVYLKDGCNNGFHKDELEIISSSSWKPSGELLEALHTAAYLHEMELYGGLKDKLCELYEQLKKL